MMGASGVALGKYNSRPIRFSFSVSTICDDSIRNRRRVRGITIGPKVYWSVHDTSHDRGTSEIHDQLMELYSSLSFRLRK